jgi:hypothetical protein
MDNPTSDIVTQLVESQVHRAIRGYRSNFLAVMKAIKEGWIPEGVEPGLTEHLDALRDHLAATGVSESDTFLLRYALTVPGMQRGIVPPLLVLEPNRSGFSERRKREAAGQVNRLGEALALARAFLTGLSRETLQAIRELDAIASTRPEAGAPPLFDQICRLSNDQARELASVALHCLENAAAPVRDLGEDLLHGLACFRFEPLDSKICRSLRERSIFWPASLYRDAGNDEAQALLGLLDDDVDLLGVSHLLLSVAWTRSEAAVASFRDWAKNPPRWASRLHVPPGDYPPSAGWSLNAKGERLELISPSCHRLRPAVANTPKAIACLAPSEQICPCCASPAVVLFDFTTIQDDLPKEAPAKVVCCRYCSMFAPSFVQYSHGSSWEWVASEATPPRTHDLPFRTRYVAREMADCPPFATANTFAIDDASTIGGVPMWLQDAEYPRCPTCAEYMTFLAQHDNSALQDEGLYYAFFCPACHISAVAYQQT